MPNAFSTFIHKADGFLNSTASHGTQIVCQCEDTPAGLFPDSPRECFLGIACLTPVLHPIATVSRLLENFNFCRSWQDLQDYAVERLVVG